MCEYCEKEGYSVLNGCPEYSSVEISLMAKIGYIRVRADFNENGIHNFVDTAKINYCPMCGRRLGELREEEL